MTIRFFAAAADIAGSRLMVAPSSLRTVGDIRIWLLQEFPLAEALWGKCLIAVGQTYASNDHLLMGNEEVAVIPPVSGG